MTLYRIATASYQVEGAWNIDGKGRSIWDRFAHKSAISKQKRMATLFMADHRYNEDIDLMRQMHIPASRFFYQLAKGLFLTAPALLIKKELIFTTE